MMFFMLFIVISPISMTYVIQQSMHKDGNELVTNSEGAVNNSWGKESCIRSLDNVKLLYNFMNMCYNILIMFNEYQQDFKEGCIQSSSFIKKTLFNCKNSTILNNRLAQSKQHLQQKLIIICKKDKLLQEKVFTVFKLYFHYLFTSNGNLVVKQKNVRKSINCYAKTYFNLKHIGYSVNVLFRFMYRLLSIEENPEGWLNDMITNANQFHAYFHELVFRYHEAFIHNKVCPFDEDCLKKLNRIRKQFEHEYEAENEYWSTHEISLGRYNLIISMSCLMVQFDSTNAPNNPYQHGNQAENNYLVQSNDDSETRVGSRRSARV